MPSIIQRRVGSKGLSEEFSFKKIRELWGYLVEIKEGKMKK